MRLTTLPEDVTPALVMNERTLLPMWFVASAGADPTEPVPAAAAASALMWALSVAVSATAPVAVTLLPAVGRAMCASTVLLMLFVDEAPTMALLPENDPAPVIEKMLDDSVALRFTLAAVAVSASSRDLTVLPIVLTARDAAKELF